ncbi:MAG TPA: serine hydrolase [Opitutus sp.]|nr:serine hydrolase [Opitutus sp.]
MKPALLVLFLLSSLFPTVRGAELKLPRGAPEAEGVDPAGVVALANAFSKIDAVHSFILVRHGKVVAEAWWKPYTADDVHIMYSATKSFTSTAIGLAQAEGRLSINDKVLSFFPDLAPKEPSHNLQEMRIRDLLAMASGHQKDTMDRLREHPDSEWRRAYLALDVENKPGTHFIYNSGNSYMLGAIITKLTGQTTEEYLEPRLFAPLGIEKHPWPKTAEGVSLGEGGLLLTTESLAKFGLLYLQKGMWDGKRLLPESWVEQVQERQSSTGGNPDSNWDYGYGFQFWRNKGGGYRADGAFGQFSFILPKYDVVLAVTCGTSNTAGVMDAVWANLVPALHYVALPANPAADDEMHSVLAKLALPAASGEAHSAREAAVSRQSYACPENEQQLKSVRVDFSGANPVITFVDADGAHAITCGRGDWVRGTTDYQKHVSGLFDYSPQGIAACGAWSSEDTYVAKLCFDETPYTITMTMKFDGDRLVLDTEQNLRFGARKRPQIVATKETNP